MRLVLDASVTIKMFTDEQGSASSRTLIESGAQFIAPSLVVVEVANVLLKRFRRREVVRTYAAHVLTRATMLFDEFVPIESLNMRAFEIAADYGTSVYDALYVALAEARGWPLATADLRLVERLKASGLAIDVWTP
jgi:predicted nucleic acid-binding protein